MAAALVVGAGLTLAGVGLDPDAGVGLALGLILVAGFPHGAADLSTLERAGLMSAHGGLRADLIQRAGTVGAYLAAMGLTAAVWWIAPALGLLGFVALSVAHFGHEQLAALELRGGWAWPYALTWGTFALVAPLTWRPDGLLPVATAMLGYSPAAGAVTGAYWASVVALGMAAAIAVGGYVRTREPRWAIELALLGLLAACSAWMPGLWAFTVFFLGVHAWSATLTQVRWRAGGLDAAELVRFLRVGAPYALLSVVAIAGVMYLAGEPSVGPGLIADFFILVSVFTTPHAAVNYLAFRRGRAVAGRG